MMDTAAAAQILGARLVGASVPFARVTTDSRTLQRGDLFVALAGERFDGHDFVAAAFERGAAAALVADARADAIAGNLVVVADPLAALARLAAHWRRQFPLPVAVVVGSNGKTTVKEMLAAILRAAFGDDAVHATQGNLNNSIGLPITVLGLRAQHRAAVIELGMNHAGETATLADVAQPTIAVINNAQREHQEFMRTVAEVAVEHAALARALPVGGVAVINADDAFVGVWRDAVAPGAAVVEFALDHPAAVRGRYTGASGALDLATPAGDFTVRLGTRGRHNAANALAAATAALAMDVPVAAVARGLEAFRPVAGRLVALTGSSGAAVIDDTYNANPDSVRAAIDVLAAAPSPRWLVLGDMGEVGAQGPGFHREAGAYARETGVDKLYAVGTLAAEAAEEFGRAARHFGSVEELTAQLVADAAASAGAGTTILVKGSRFMRMERVVSALIGAPAAAGVH